MKPRVCCLVSMCLSAQALALAPASALSRWGGPDPSVLLERARASIMDLDAVSFQCDASTLGKQVFGDSVAVFPPLSATVKVVFGGAKRRAERFSAEVLAGDGMSGSRRWRLGGDADNVMMSEGGTALVATRETHDGGMLGVLGGAGTLIPWWWWDEESWQELLSAPVIEYRGPGIQAGELCEVVQASEGEGGRE